MPDDVDDAIRALYAGDHADFVKGRATLAKEHKERAAELKALRKPERRAWTLDRAASEDPDALARFVAAAGAVADAQERGGDLRAATTALRDAVRALAARTPDPGVATADLVAVVADPDALDALRAGRLVAIPEAGGFGPLPAGPAPARPAGDDPAGDAAERKAERARQAALAKARKAAEKEVAAAEAALDKAARAREAAEQAEREAAERLDDARAALEESGGPS